MLREQLVRTEFCLRHNLSKLVHESDSCRNEVPDSALAELVDCLLDRFAMGSGAGQAFRSSGGSTNDREADLIDALVRADRFDDAEAICQSRLRGVDPRK